MKKTLSLFLSLVMAITCIGGVSISANAGDFTTATALSFSDSFSGDYYLTDDTYYKITVPSDGLVTIMVMNYSNYKYLYVYDYNLLSELAYTSVSTGNDNSPATTTLSRAMSKGTYYIKLKNSDSGYENQKYKLYVNFTSYNVTDDGSTDSLDSYDSPFILSSGTTVTGALTLTDGVDWYKITVPSDGTYVFTFWSYSSDKDIDIYNSSLSSTLYYSRYSLSSGSEASPAFITKNLSLSAGTYYIEISTGDRGKYALSWDKLTQENCTHSYSSSTVSATYFAKGYTLHTCSICGKTYKSDYTAKLKVTKQSIYSLKKGKKKITVTCYQSNVDGIQIQYSTSKKFPSGSKTKTVTTKKTTKTIKKLKSNKKYYVRVRGYKVVNGKKAYSAWSTVKSVKTK